jgi:hypothetical protein
MTSSARLPRSAKNGRQAIGGPARVATTVRSGARPVRLLPGCCHAAVAVSLTGSRTVLSPKSATRSSRPPRAST